MNDNINGIISFDGTSETWNIWNTRFIAKATINGYAGIMLGDIIPPEANDATTDEAELLARKMNGQGYCDLLLAMKTNVCMEAIIEARTKELPNGDLFKAWETLKEIFFNTLF